MSETKLRIGKWACVLSAIFSIAWFISFSLLEGLQAGPVWTELDIFTQNITMTRQIHIYPALLFSVTYVIFLASLHMIVEESKKLWTLIALAFGVVFSVTTIVNHNIQAVSIRMNMANLAPQGLEMFILKNKSSIFNSITSSNNFVAISLFVSGLIFNEDKLGRWIKILLLAQIIPVVGKMVYSIFNLNETIYIAINMLFVVGAPLAFILIAIWLHKKIERKNLSNNCKKEESIQIPLMFL